MVARMQSEAVNVPYMVAAIKSFVVSDVWGVVDDDMSVDDEDGCWVAFFVFQ